jgi:predicted dehydrogenase
MRVGLIGAKLQGLRRAPVIQSFLGTELVVISAAHKESAQALANKFGCEVTVGWEGVVKRSDLDAVVVCTPPHLHAQISIAAMESGKHVLCEKPLARTLQEAEVMVEAAKANRVKLKCGFNHRYHPAVQKARELIDQGRIGKPSFIRCRYGIGGRLGYEKEWRANPEMVGGGQLMEQGIHALDLSRWFLGEFREVAAFIADYFWKTEPLEDNAFVLLRTEDGRIASIHSSLMQWKNMFSFEIFGSEGYINVEGLGRSYGTERLVFGKREFLKPFAEEVVEFRGEDRSSYEEWKEFVACVEENREPLGSGYDGLVAMRLVNAAYESARKHCFVTLQ